MNTSSGQPENVRPGLLGGNRLTTFEAAGVSVAGLAPVMAMALGTAFAASEAGDAVPLCYVFAFVGSLALAYVIVRFARSRPGSGLAFTYADAAFGKTLGFAAGAAYALAWLFAIAVVLAISAVAISSIVSEHGGHVGWFPLFIGELIIAFVLNYVGVKPSVRLQVIAEVGSMIAVTGIFVAALASSKSPGLSLQPFNPSISVKGVSGIGYGAIFGFAGFAGFEGAAALGFETRNPRRGVPRAILWSLVGAGVFYIFITYALAVLYGQKGVGSWAASAAPLGDTLTKFLGSDWASAVEAMVALSGFSSGLGLLVLAPRVLHGMSLRGVMPRVLSKEHPRFRTPSYGILIACLVAVALGTGLGLWQGSSTLIGFMASFNTLMLIAVYGAVSAGAIFVFSRHVRWRSRWHAIIIPSVAIGLLGYAFYASIIPVPAFPFNLVPYLVAGVVAVLLAVGVKLRGRRDFDFTALIDDSTGSDAQAPVVPPPEVRID